MPALLIPAALAALLAVAIPLLVHLARRSEAQPTDFAALKWLREKPRPKSRLKFDEWPLLAARLALITLLALWLARPVLPDSADTRPVIAAIPGVDPGPPAPDTRNLWLAPGFPPADQPQESCLALPLSLQERSNLRLRNPEEAVCNPSTLIRQLDATLAPGVSLTLIIPEILSNLDAESPRLSRSITWKIVSGAMPAPPQTKANVGFALPQTDEPGLRYIRAAAAALTKPGPVTQTITVHMTPGPLPAALESTITNGTTALVAHNVTILGAASTVWRDTEGVPLATLHPHGKGRIYRFTRPLTPATMPILLDPAFPTQLAAMLSPSLPPTRAHARDMRPTTGAPAWPFPARDLQPWLAWAIAAAFLAERWLATRRTRAVTP
jgi:hypothetical protein